MKGIQLFLVLFGAITIFGVFYVDAESSCPVAENDVNYNCQLSYQTTIGTQSGKTFGDMCQCDKKMPKACKDNTTCTPCVAVGRKCQTENDFCCPRKQKTTSGPFYFETKCFKRGKVLRCQECVPAGLTCDKEGKTSFCCSGSECKPKGGSSIYFCTKK